MVLDPPIDSLRRCLTMRCLTALCLLVAWPLAASANGFGLFHRPQPAPATYYAPVVPVQSYYYAPATLYPSFPLAVETVPVIPYQAVVPSFPVGPTVPVAPVVPAIPQQPGVPQAPIEVAPPSNDPLIPSDQPMPTADGRSTSAKVATTVFDLYTNGDARPASTPARFVVRFWNLSADTIQLTIDGKTVSVPRGQSRTVETGSQFAWQVSGRAPEVSQVPAEARGVTVTIRR
jgi:hypothetical protein